jgi:hypothetical protein
LETGSPDPRSTCSVAVRPPTERVHTFFQFEPLP